MANRIPRNFTRIMAELAISGMAGQKGDRFEIVRNEYGELSGTSLVTEKEWHIFPSHLRNENFWHIVEVV